MIAQTPTTKELIPLIDHAAQAGDRWMFIVLLVIGLFAAWIIMRYSARRHEALEAQLAELNKYIRETLTTNLAKTESTLASATDTLEDAANVIKESKSILWAAHTANAAKVVTTVIIVCWLCGCAHWTPEQRAAHARRVDLFLTALASGAGTALGTIPVAAGQVAVDRINGLGSTDTHHVR